MDKWVNTALTLAVILSMLINIAPPEFAFMIGVSLALVINFKSVDEQMERLRAHAPNALMMAAVIIAAGMFLGVLNETGMLKAIATNLIKVIPAEVGPYLHIIVGLLGVPLDLLTEHRRLLFCCVTDRRTNSRAIWCTVCINSLFNGYREYYRYICQSVFTSLMVGNWFSRGKHGHVY